MELTPLSLSEFNVTLRKHVDRASPVQLRLMAARGVIPMAPAELGMVLYQLSFDSKREVAKSALETLKTAPIEVIAAAAESLVNPQVLSWLFYGCAGRVEIVRRLILNPALPSEAIARLARVANTELCDLIAENQVRLLQAPQIIESLYLNKSARMSTLDRLIDFAQRSQISLDGLPGLSALMNSGASIVEDVQSAENFSDERMFEALNTEDDEGLKEKETLASKGHRKEQEEPVENEEENRGGSRKFKLGKMSVSQRVRVAIMGSIGDRDVLVRDPNRVIHMAAINSPKTTQREAQKWASNPSVPDTVIQYIANKKEWLRNYNIKLCLCENPKLPLQKGLRLLQYLRPNDLKALATNRNINQVLRRQAGQLVKKRTEMNTE
jgi:hypothetical protein